MPLSYREKCGTPRMYITRCNTSIIQDSPLEASLSPLAFILTIILLFFTPLGSAHFWLTLVALLGLIGMQATYWLFTHPVNKFWLPGQKLSGLGSGFFSLGANRSQPLNKSRAGDWTDLRNRWEYSHVARAGLAFASLTTLVIAISNAASIVVYLYRRFTN